MWPKLPPPTAFLPLVILISSVVPGLYAGFFGSLNLEQSIWGLAGLDVLDGGWLIPSRDANTLPPLYAWLTALGLTVPLPDRICSVGLPDYLLGLATLLLVYKLGSLCLSPGAGLLACLLVAMNRVFLEEIHRSTSTPCILCFALLCICLFLQHARHQDDLLSSRVIAASLAFTALLLCSGFFSFWIPLICVLNLLHDELPSREDWPSTIREIVFESSTLQSGLIVLGCGVVLSSPWLLAAGWHLGPFAPWADPLAGSPRVNVVHLVTAMPATIVPALYGLFRTIREAVYGAADSRLTILPVVWALIGCLALETTHPTRSALLLTAIPLTYLAVRVLFAILRREIRDRDVLTLMLGSVAVYLVVEIDALRRLPFSFQGEPMSPEQQLDLHFGVDALVLAIGLIIWLFRWTNRDDRYRRVLLGGFVIASMALACLPGLTKVAERPRRFDPWLQVSQALRQERRSNVVVFLGEHSPSPQLEFTVRTILPSTPRVEINDSQDLEGIIRTYGPRPLVLVTSSNRRLARTLPVATGDATVTLTQFFDSEQVIGYSVREQPNVDS